MTITTSEIRYIRDNVNKMTKSELARRLGCKYSHVIYICHHLAELYDIDCYHRRTYTAAEDKAIIDAYNGGMTFGGILQRLSNKTGRTRYSVAERVRYLRRHGIDVPRISRTNTAWGVHAERFAELRRQGRTIGDIAIMLGIGKSTAYKINERLTKEHRI